MLVFLLSTERSNSGSPHEAKAVWPERGTSAVPHLGLRAHGEVLTLSIDEGKQQISDSFGRKMQIATCGYMHHRIRQRKTRNVPIVFTLGHFKYQPS